MAQHSALSDDPKFKEQSPEAKDSSTINKMSVSVTPTLQLPLSNLAAGLGNESPITPLPYSNSPAWNPDPNITVSTTVPCEANPEYVSEKELIEIQGKTLYATHCLRSNQRTS